VGCYKRETKGGFVFEVEHATDGTDHCRPAGTSHGPMQMTVRPIACWWEQGSEGIGIEGTHIYFYLLMTFPESACPDVLGPRLGAPLRWSFASAQAPITWLTREPHRIPPKRSGDVVVGRGGARGTTAAADGVPD